MRRMIVFASACVLALAGIVPSAQEGPTLQSALAALGANGLRSLQFTATGEAYVLGQPPTAAEPWPVRPIKSYQGNPHNEQTLVAWLPSERILFQSDMMNPPAPGGQVPPPTPAIANFYDNLVRLKIVPEQIVGGHGNRIATHDDLLAVAGKAGTN